MSTGANEARRQAAQLAALDALNDATKYTHTVDRAVKGAIETATRVRVTDASIQAMTGSRGPVTPGSKAWHARRRELERALSALGFEVVE